MGGTQARGASDHTFSELPVSQREGCSMPHAAGLSACIQGQTLHRIFKKSVVCAAADPREDIFCPSLAHGQE